MAQKLYIYLFDNKNFPSAAPAYLCAAPAYLCAAPVYLWAAPAYL